MSAVITEASTLEEKILELCQFIVDDPAYSEAQGHIEAFESDKSAQDVYRNWQQKAAELHQIHQQGSSPTDADIVEAERLREIVMDNAVANSFCGAEDSLNSIFGTVVKMVQLSLQNGRVPTEADMNECCGSGTCGSC